MMPDDECINILKAMADSTRLSIIKMLNNGKLCACKIQEHFNFTQPTLSYHMKILINSGLVNGVREGAWMRYTLNQPKIDEFVKFIDNIAKINTNITFIDKEGKCQ